MNALCHNLRVVIVGGIVSLLLILSGCITVTQTPYTGERLLVVTPVPTNILCPACDLATLSVMMTQDQNNANYQAAATADNLRANAQATFNSANATLNAVQTQDQNNANFLAAQVAATAEVARANAQATLNSASSTQIAAMTQAQYNLQNTQMVGTQGAAAVITQQNKDDLASNTQTAIANNIATQTQVAVATSQWYTDQARQREEQRTGPITFLWTWCLPMFIVLLAGLSLWGFWRWLKIQQNNQRILEAPVEKIQAPVVEVLPHRHIEEPIYLESDTIDDRYQLTTPDDDQVHDWLDEVKDKLRDSDEKDEDNDSNS